MKDYNEELWKFFDMLMNGENFSLSRFGDGELTIIEGKREFDMIKGGNETEFAYYPGSEKGEISRTLLKESFESTLPNYFKGIPINIIKNKQFTSLWVFFTSCRVFSLQFRPVV